MKKLLVTISSLTFLTVCQASENPHHLISVGTEGLGWSGIGEVYKTSKNLDSAKTSAGSLQLNYAYIFENKVMLGLEFGTNTNSLEYKDLAGDETKITSSTTKFALNAGYNFNDDVFNSWWLQAAYGSISTKSETETTTTDTTESDATGFSLRFGKRFNFPGLGLKNISYAPSIAYSSKSWTGDLADAGAETSAEVQLNLLKFDVLF